MKGTVISLTVKRAKSQQHNKKETSFCGAICGHNPILGFKARTRKLKEAAVTSPC
jgi:hypothetical protein